MAAHYDPEFRQACAYFEAYWQPLFGTAAAPDVSGERRVRPVAHVAQAALETAAHPGLWATFDSRRRLVRVGLTKDLRRTLRDYRALPQERFYTTGLCVHNCASGRALQTQYKLAFQHLHQRFDARRTQS